MNKRSILGFEYINIVNDDINTPECTRDAAPPTTTTTETTTSTTTSTSTTVSSTDQVLSSTETNAELQTEDDLSFRWDIFWIAFSSLVVVSVISVILGLLYVYVIKPRIYTRTLEVTRSVDDSPNDTKYEYDTSDIQTLPRLHVLHDPVDGPYISGINYIRNISDDNMK